MSRVCVFLAIVTAASAIQPLQPRIVGGVETNITRHPYQVSLQKYGKHFCGGAILAPKVVVTAAKCLYDADVELYLLSVRAGSSYREKGGVVVAAESYEYHPGYEMSLRDFDFAVVKLKTALQFGETIRPIALVPENQEPEHGEMLTISGWGKTNYSKIDPLPTHLHELRLPCLDRYYCRLAFGNTRVTYNMLCAGGILNNRPYLADSGGPLVNDKKQLVGLFSYRKIESTNFNGYPTFYANLASPRIRKFLKKQTGL